MVSKYQLHEKYCSMHFRETYIQLDDRRQNSTITAFDNHFVQQKQSDRYNLQVRSKVRCRFRPARRIGASSRL